MTDKLGWHVHGVSFEDGSRLADWTKIHESGVWIWQYDTHELSFDIYEHDGQFWKLYRARFADDDASGYALGYGGQACRVVLVRYPARAKSPHSSLIMEAGAEEWVRTYEVDKTIHEVVKAGRADPKYGAPYGPKRAA
jgi:hypothetical protein